jgi:ketol-acid reductoisomerase
VGAAGFAEEDGALGEMFDVIAASDMVLLLISDAAQAELHEPIFAALRPGTTLGLSHGFEATDSLNPYMHARGVSYMVDNCSTTARLGSRKWAPRFDYLLTQAAYPALDDRERTLDTSVVKAFADHPIHEVLRICAQLRPSVDIFVE